MRQAYRLIYNALVSWGSRLAEVLISFLLLPFLVNRLGTAAYGVFGLAFSVSATLDLLRAGVAAALTKYIAGYTAQGRQDLVNRMLGTTCAFTTAVGLAGGGGLILLRTTLADVMHIESLYRVEFERALLFMGLLVIVSFPVMPYLGVLHGHQRYDVSRIAQTSVRALRAGLMVAWFLLRGPSITALVVITLVCGAILHVCWVVAARRLWPWLRSSPRQFRWSTLTTLLGFGAMIILIQLTTVASLQLPRWIVASMISVDFVTYFAVMITPYILLSQVMQDLTLTVMPVASKYQAVDDRQILIHLLIRGTRYSLLASGVCVAVVVPIMRPFLKLWMGPDFEHLAPPMVLIAICAALGTSGLCAHNILKGLGKVGQVLLRGIVSAGVCLGVMAAAIRWFHATTWAVGIGLSAGFVTSGLLHNVMGIIATRAPLGRFLWRAYGQPLLVLTPILAAAGWLVHKADLRGAVPLGLVGLGTAGLFALSFALIFFTEQERQLAREVFSAVKRRVLRRA